MKTTQSSIKDKIISRYFKEEAPTKQVKSTDINILLNSIRFMGLPLSYCCVKNVLRNSFKDLFVGAFKNDTR